MPFAFNLANSFYSWPDHTPRLLWLGPNRILRQSSSLLIIKILLPALLLILLAAPAYAAVACDLNDPDRDVPRLFPESTSYRTKYLSFRQQGGDLLLRNVQSRLGDKYLALYAPIDVPYTLYEIYNGAKKVGYIHGVNQKGQFGGIQVFMVQDLTGRIKNFYLQKVTGRTAGKFRDAKFYKLFAGVSLKDFESYDPASAKGSGRIAEIRNPNAEMETDFHGILRGLKKNLILMDEFVFSSAKGSQ